jgi:hypothetical protein
VNSPAATITVGPGAVLRALGGELLGVFAAARRTKLSMWLAYGAILTLAASVGALPLGWPALVLQVAGFMLVAMLVVWPEVFARGMREDDVSGVRERDSAAVVRYLPVVVATFALPIYLLAQAVLFRGVMRHLPGVLVGDGWGAAWRLSFDNLLLTEMFFDLFDVFGLNLAAEPGSVAGRLLVFGTRFLLSVGFVRIALSLGRAAYYRAHGLGRGADLLAELEEAVARRDAVEAGHLGRELTTGVRETADLLLARGKFEARSEASLRGLRALRDWVIPYLRSRANFGDPDGAALESLVEELGAGRKEAERAVPRPRFWLSGTAFLLTAATLAGAALGSGWLPFALGLGFMVLLGWLLASPRASYEWAMEHGLVPFVSLAGLRGATVAWAGGLTALFLLASWGALWHGANLWPGAFAGSGTSFDRGGLLGFVASSLLRIQLFFSVPDIFGLAQPALEQRPVVGSLLTLALRTGLNLGSVAVVLTAITIQRDRWGLSGLVGAPDDLAMRVEALRGGRYAHLLVTYHDLRVGQRLWSALDAAEDADTQDALVASGAFDWCLLYTSLEEAFSPARLRSQAAVVGALHERGWNDTVTPLVQELDAALHGGEWPLAVQVQVQARRAVIDVRDGNIPLATERLALAYGWLLDEGDAMSSAERQEACALWARSVLRALAIFPPDAVTDGTAFTLAERATEMLQDLRKSDPERFTTDALRAGTLHAVLRGRAEGVADAAAELAELSDEVLALPAGHPWRLVLLVQVAAALTAARALADAEEASGSAVSDTGAVGSSAAVDTGAVGSSAAVDTGTVGSGAAPTDTSKAGESPAASLSALEERVTQALGVAPGQEWDAKAVATRAYDERLGEELSQLVIVLSGLPPSRAAYLTATRVADIFQARYDMGVFEARGHAIGLRMMAVLTVHGLGDHEEVLAAAYEVFRRAEGLRPSPPDEHLLALTHALCARSARALGREELAWEHAALARSHSLRIVESGWDGAAAAAAEVSSYLSPLDAGLN